MVLIFCDHLCGHRGSGRHVDHHGTGPVGPGRHGVCRGLYHRSGLYSCLCSCPYHRGGGLYGRDRHSDRLCEACCACRRSRNRGCRAGDRLGVGARHMNHMCRDRGASHAVCCFVAVVWPVVHRSLTQTRSRIFFCVASADSLNCGEHYIMHQQGLNAYLLVGAAHRLRNALCAGVNLVGCLDGLDCLVGLLWVFAAPIWASRLRSYRSGSWAQLAIVSEDRSIACICKLTTPWGGVVTSSHICDLVLLQVFLGARRK